VSSRLVKVRRAGRVRLAVEPPPATPPPARRPAKLAQLLALAHHIEALIKKGAVRDRADVARRLGFTRSRITQILDLTLLAPDIQEEILFAEAVDGREPFTERDARKIALIPEWWKQRDAWRAATAGTATDG
jgi:ParB-like chromosome segregation protein Spo0J